MLLAMLAAAPQEVDPYLRIGATGVYSEAEVSDFDEIDGSSVRFESEAGVDLDWDDTRVNFEADADYVEFTNEDFTDRWRYRLRAEVEQDLTEALELRLRAEGSWATPSVEYFDVDELELRSRLEWEPVRAHRVRGEFRWRERSYNDGSDATGSGPRVDLDYRYRFDAYHYLELETWFEEIDSDDPYRRYNRRAGQVSYTHPLTDDLRVRPALAYRDTDFPDRAADTAPFRQDEEWVPEVEFLWWPGDWRMSAEFQYRWRDSTDLSRDRSGPRVEVKVAYVF